MRRRSCRFLLTISTLLALPFASIANASPDGLVAHYLLNGDLNDRLGQGNRGKLFNGAEYGVGMDGLESGAVKVDGVNAYVLFGRNDQVYPSQELTWSIWFMPTKQQAAVLVWDDDSTSGGDRGIGIKADGTLCGGTFNSDRVSSRVKPALGRWHHAVFTSGTQGQHLYLNGKLVGKSPKRLELHYGKSTVSIGAGHVGHGSPNGVYHDRFCGMLDNFRIYNRPLSELEVRQLNAEEFREQPPRGARAKASTTNGFVTEIKILDGGYGYLEVPQVTVAGPCERPCAATATVSEGAISKITITDPGAGYLKAPEISITPPKIRPRAASAGAVVNGGFVVDLEVRDGGAMYTSPPKVYIQGGGGKGAEAVAEIENGEVVEIRVTKPGAGYTSAPAVKIAPPEESAK